MKKAFSLILILVILVSLSACSNRNRDEKPLGCVTLPNADSLMKITASAFVSKLKDRGYETHVAYYGSDVATQLKQIQNFIAMGADIIGVDCVGDSEAYEEVFAEARKHGSKIMVLESSGEVKNCDIQAKSYHIFKGMRMCELLKQYLDEEYPGAEPNSVTVLFLEMSNKIDYIRMGAGYRLIKEKYLRYYNHTVLDFMKEETGETVYYLDSDGNKVAVDEPAGGLILDKNGYAQLNSFYDERVNLCYAADKNVRTNLDAQSAIDAFMTTPNGRKLRIVLAFEGDAGIGAAERLKYYQETGIINAEVDKLAVFGSGDSQTNWELMQDSVSNQSLFRGFVCGENTTAKVISMLDMVLKSSGDIYLVTSSSRSLIIENGSKMGLVNIQSSVWKDPDMFFSMIKDGD